MEKRGENGAEAGAERGDLKIFRGGAGRPKIFRGAGRNGAPFADPCRGDPGVGFNPTGSPRGIWWVDPGSLRGDPGVLVFPRGHPGLTPLKQNP